MRDVSVPIRKFVAAQTAAVEAAFRAAFEQALADALEEWRAAGGDELDDEPDVEDALARIADERRRLLLFYVPAVSRAASELRAILTDYRTQLHAALQAGASEAELTALAARYKAVLDQKQIEIERRMRLMIEGIMWAAAEAAHAAVAEMRGATIYWNLDPASEHCESCPALAAGSPYASIAEIGGVPGGDLTKCKAKCRCYFSFGAPD